MYIFSVNSFAIDFGASWKKYLKTASLERIMNLALGLLKNIELGFLVPQHLPLVSNF